MTDLFPCIVCGERVHPELMHEHYNIRHQTEEAQVAENSNGVTYSETIRVLAFVVAVLPLLIPINLLVWKIALSW